MTMFQANPRLKWRPEGKDKVLLNSLAVLNRTAGEVLDLAKSPTDLPRVTAAMQERYPHTPPDKLQADIGRLLAKLERMNIIIPPESAPSPPTPLYMNPASFHQLESSFGNRLSAPTEVVIELTFRCNAHCRFCYAPSTTHFDADELTTAEWCSVIDQLHDMRVFSLTFTGGEAILRPDLDELIAHASRRGLKTLLLTNGWYLSEERIERLIAAGLAGIDISLDGIDEETHDASRGLKGLYRRALPAITALAQRDDIELTVLTSITSLNVRQVPAIMDLADSLGVRMHFLARFLPIGRGADHPYLEPTVEDYLDLLPKIYERQHTRRTAFISYAWPAAYVERAIGLEAYHELVQKGRFLSCSAGITEAWITPTGEVRPCRVSHNVPLGNIRNGSLREIWQTSPVLEHLRTVTKQEQEPCAGCRLRSECLSGCRALDMQLGPGGNRYVADMECATCFATFFAKTACDHPAA